ncbi:MAG: hypothetical protein OEY79_03935 [Anaplasmataceae bacterium]|nr:hypothetical protein [Anaplasmataceae bacterium]
MVEIIVLNNHLQKIWIKSEDMDQAMALGQISQDAILPTISQMLQQCTQYFSDRLIVFSTWEISTICNGLINPQPTTTITSLGEFNGIWKFNATLSPPSSLTGDPFFL